MNFRRLCVLLGSLWVGRKTSPECDLQGAVLLQALGGISNSADPQRSCLLEPTGAQFPTAKPKLVNGNYRTWEAEKDQLVRADHRGVAVGQTLSGSALASRCRGWGR